jgi:hypothetical protein
VHTGVDQLGVGGMLGIKAVGKTVGRGPSGGR